MNQHKIRKKLFKRDGNLCWICKEPIDRSLSNEHFFMATIDHVVPKSKGGSNRLENLRLAHLICNIKRGSSSKEKNIQELYYCKIFLKKLKFQNKKHKDLNLEYIKWANRDF